MHGRVPFQGRSVPGVRPAGPVHHTGWQTPVAMAYCCAVRHAHFSLRNCTPCVDKADVPGCPSAPRRAQELLLTSHPGAISPPAP